MQLTQNATLLRLSDDVLTEASLRIVHRCLEEADTPVIQLDLGDIRLPTADGLGALVALNKELRSRGGTLVLSNITAAVYEVFCLTQLVEVLTFSPSERLKKVIPD
jgi:anti-anti-sigma factor